MLQKEAIAMRMIAEWFPEFAEKFEEIDALYKEKSGIDEKTYQYICLALAIRGRSAPCVKKHFYGALQAGATLQEVAAVVALTFRESAGNDDCWFHDIMGDYKEIMQKGIGDCCCK